MYKGAIKGDYNCLKRAGAIINESSRPLIILGQGIVRPGRYSGIGEVLNKMEVSVITTIFTLLC